MSNLTVGLLSALLATNQPVAVSNLVHEKTGLVLPIADVEDPVERQLRALMLADDAALDDVKDWIRVAHPTRHDTNAFAQLDRKIRERLDGVKQDYERFLKSHPDHARGCLAFGSFLQDIGEVDSASVQFENARRLDPKNPAAWNQLANYHGEFGNPKKAFEYYAEAIRLDPSEPVYWQNMATTVFLFRKDAQEYYRITEPQVFDKALELYRQAMKLAPDSLVLATDYASSYYGIKPLRTNDALAGWTNALSLCRDENERQGVEIHLARVKSHAGFYEEAQQHLNRVTNQVFMEIKDRLQRGLNERRNPSTNPVSPPTPMSSPALPVK